VLGRLAADRAFDKLEAGSIGRCNGWTQMDAEKEDAGTYMIAIEECCWRLWCFVAVMIDCYDQEDSEEEERKVLSVGCLFVEQAS
jgi:hypothetical protein